MKIIHTKTKRFELATDDLLSVEEVCEALGISRQTLYNRRNDITGIKIDGRVYFLKSDIERLILRRS